jgi:hypothetical protein
LLETRGGCTGPCHSAMGDETRVRVAAKSVALPNRNSPPHSARSRVVTRAGGWDPSPRHRSHSRPHRGVTRAALPISTRRPPQPKRRSVPSSPKCPGAMDGPRPPARVTTLAGAIREGPPKSKAEQTKKNDGVGPWIGLTVRSAHDGAGTGGSAERRDHDDQIGERVIEQVRVRHVRQPPSRRDDDWPIGATSAMRGRHDEFSAYRPVRRRILDHPACGRFERRRRARPFQSRRLASMSGPVVTLVDDDSEEGRAADSRARGSASIGCGRVVPS